ncbi:uncharacterized protein OCT59_028501 [Rhizophagus irregularis]|nr:hypothetical protein OCT59_028501 [Rhizophagus irregularis]
MIFRLIDDPAPKRLIEASRVGNNSLCRDYVANIPENYPFRRDPLLMFEDNEKPISEIYSTELARLGGIKTKIVHIAHPYEKKSSNFCTIFVQVRVEIVQLLQIFG